MENQDENIKKFNLRNYYNENKKIFVSFLILVIVSTILVIGVREYYSKVNKDISNEFNKAKILIQKNMGYLKLETTAGITPYPVQINLNDIIIIMFLILSIGFIISVILSRIVFSKK